MPSTLYRYRCNSDTLNPVSDSPEKSHRIAAKKSLQRADQIMDIHRDRCAWQNGQFLWVPGARLSEREEVIPA
jgi:hypothetical protein